MAIGGFILSGNSPRRLIIRGSGPSLAASRVPNPLLDPTLSLYNGTTNAVIAVNDDWQNTANADQIPAGFQPSDPRESVIIATLQPGPYTVIEAGSGDTTGVGLVEVYDLDTTDDAMLANIATRGLCMTGDNVMIAGFITGGSINSSTVVVRAIGPSLQQARINNSLQDPTLELHDANGVLIGNNDNWKDDPSQAAQLITLGFAPSDDRESAIVVNLPPAGYTVIVDGKNGGVGVALVEVYNLQ